MTSLNPLHTIEKQIGEILLLHRGMTGAAARDAHPRAARPRSASPIRETRLQSYPHQLSGGQRQRVMIAMALANEPDLLIADEPTTALDVTVQAQILKLLKELQARLGMAMLFITHDLGIVRKIADRVCVMKEGKIVEQGPVERRLHRARSIPTPARCSPPSRSPIRRRCSPTAPIVIETDDLKVWFPIKRGVLRKTVGHIKAVDGVSIAVRKGETLGVVGESGSGKTTLGLAILRLISSTGPIVFLGKPIAGPEVQGDAAVPPRHADRVPGPLRLAHPAHVGLRHHRGGPAGASAEAVAAEREQRVIRALDDVGLDPETRFRYPHEFSGGQRQRIAVARAIVLEPTFVVLDEPTSALDMLIQAQIVDLLRDLQKRHDLTYLFISHDLRVVAALASRLIVMRNGKVVEEGPAAELFAASEERLHARAVRRRLQSRDRARRRRRPIGSRRCRKSPRPRTRSLDGPPPTSRSRRRSCSARAFAPRALPLHAAGRRPRARGATRRPARRAGRGGAAGRPRPRRGRADPPVPARRRISRTGGRPDRDRGRPCRGGRESTEAARRECLEEIGVAPRRSPSCSPICRRRASPTSRSRCFSASSTPRRCPSAAGAAAEHEETRPLRVPIDAALAALVRRHHAQRPPGAGAAMAGAQPRPAREIAGGGARAGA